MTLLGQLNSQTVFHLIYFYADTRKLLRQDENDWEIKRGQLQGNHATQASFTLNAKSK